MTGQSASAGRFASVAWVWTVACAFVAALLFFWFFQYVNAARSGDFACPGVDPSTYETTTEVFGSIWPIGAGCVVVTTDGPRTLEPTWWPTVQLTGGALLLGCALSAGVVAIARRRRS